MHLPKNAENRFKSIFESLLNRFSTFLNAFLCPICVISKSDTTYSISNLIFRMHFYFLRFCKNGEIGVKILDFHFSYRFYSHIAIVLKMAMKSAKI